MLKFLNDLLLRILNKHFKTVQKVVHMNFRCLLIMICLRTWPNDMMENVIKIQEIRGQRKLSVDSIQQKKHDVRVKGIPRPCGARSCFLRAWRAPLQSVPELPSW